MFLPLSRSRPSRAALVAPALGATLLATAVAPASVLAADTAPPVVVSASVAPNWVNVTGGPATVTATFRLTDDSGVVLPEVAAKSDLSRETTPAGEVTRVSGDAKDGVYKAKLVVARGAAGGGWTARAPMLADIAGNATPDPVALGKFTVFAFGFDIVPPKLVSSTITPPAVDVTKAPATVVIGLRITDDYSGARPPVVDVTSPDGQDTRTLTTALLVSGDPQDGRYTLPVIVPTGTAPGAWSVELRPLRDYMGNTGKGADLGTLAVTNTTPPKPEDPVVTPGPAGPGGPGGSDGSNGGPGAPGAPGAPGSNGTNGSTPAPTAAPADQGGVRGVRVTSKSFLALAGKATSFKVSRKGQLTLSVKCTGAAGCRGSVRLYANVKGKAAKGKKAKTKKVKIVSRRVSVAAGKTIKVKFKLTAQGRKTVKRGKRLKTTVSIWTDGIKAPRTKALTVRRAK